MANVIEKVQELAALKSRLERTQRTNDRLRLERDTHKNMAARARRSLLTLVETHNHLRRRCGRVD
ncbi:MAG: hypothetical protein KAV87_13655 [Desulfobacteraceae bacterium]|nr:hypothetical protein [Desulfobacteraceae bacterium]